MKLILNALIGPVALFITNLIFNQVMQVRYYILVFALSIMGLISMRCCAEPHFTPVQMTLDYDQIQVIIEKIEYHEDEGDRAMARAEDVIWFLPSCDDKEKAEYCFTTLIASIAAPTPMSKICAACIAFLGKYGLSCMEHWQYMQKMLYEAKYHYEMKEFYEEVLVRG